MLETSNLDWFCFLTGAARLGVFAIGDNGMTIARARNIFLMDTKRYYRNNGALCCVCAVHLQFFPAERRYFCKGHLEPKKVGI